MEHYKEGRESTFSETVNDEKLKDPKNVANAFNILFKTVTKKLNIEQIEKGDNIRILKN